MKVLVSRLAEIDITEIAEWIAADNPRAAARMIDKFLAAANALSLHPHRYPEVGRTGLRKRPIGDYVILYRADDAISVVRVLHSARDWLSLLDEA